MQPGHPSTYVSTNRRAVPEEAHSEGNSEQPAPPALPILNRMIEENGVLPVSILPFGMVNAFIVPSEGGCILVDAGLPDSLPKFERALESLGRTLSDVRLIVVTHGHIDHAGCAAALREKSGAPIVAHADEIPFLSGQKAMTFCPTRPFGRLFLKTGAAQRPYQRFRPDIVLSEHRDLDLKQYGIQGRVLATPGHTPGSISVALENRTAFVGDLLASGILLGGIAFKNSPARPPFEEAPREVARQLELLVQAGNERFFLGHGGPLGADQVRLHVERLRNQCGLG